MKTGALVVCAVLLPAAVAPAATVDRRYGGRVDEEPVDIVRVIGAPGESSSLDVVVRRSGADRQGSPTVVRVHDAHGVVTAGRGCVQRARGTVTCSSVDELGELELRLGDGDDRAAVHSITRDQFIYLTVLDGSAGDDRLSTNDGGELRGGPGDDVLTGSRLYETMDGGAGDDVLRGGADGDFLVGGAGNDVLRGGPGNDDLIGGANERARIDPGSDRLLGEAGDDSLDDADADAIPPAIGPDVLDGGPGEDAVDSYRGRSAPVTLDQSTRTPAGQAGESDVVRNVERLFGGSGDDVLVGGEAANFIDGRNGDDTVAAGGGTDFVLAGERDHVTCGDGRDQIRVFSDPNALAAAGPLIHGDCELLSTGSGLALAPVPVRAAPDELHFSVVRLPTPAPTLTVTSGDSPFAALGAIRLSRPTSTLRAKSVVPEVIRVLVGLDDGWLVWRS